MTIRVVIADDQHGFRSTLRLLLDSEDDICVVGEARDGAEAVVAVRRSNPDVAILDIAMPRVDGIAATRAIIGERRLAHTRVLILTTFEFDENVGVALRAGASGFLGKDARPVDVIAAVRAVAAGTQPLSPIATRMLVNDFLTRPAAGSGIQGALATLTAREREVVVLVATGASNAEIADRLGITALTAKTHVNRAMVKLNARDRAQLVVRSYEGGLVVPGRLPDY